MPSWFRTPAQRFWAVLLVTTSSILLALMLVSFEKGTTIVSRHYTEQTFEREEIKPEQAPQFELKDRTVCELTVKGTTLDQSWIWVKTLIVDEKNRPVHSFAHNLSHYHGYEGGESWSEGDRDKSEVFVLPKGKYRVLLYGEDAKKSTRGYRKGYYTIERNERLHLEVKRDVWMSRYFVGLFILFSLITLIYFVLRHERSQYEQPWQFDQNQHS